MESNPKPPFLRLRSHRLSEDDARNAVVALLTSMSVPEAETFEIPLGNAVLHANFKDLVAEMRTEGCIKKIQAELDNSDLFFGGNFTLATDVEGATVEQSYAKYTKQIKAPGGFYRIEDQLAEGILFFREQVVKCSIGPDFTPMIRNYCAYLFNCMALIEAFISRYILVAENAPSIPVDLTPLKASRTLDERLAQWMTIFVAKDISEVKDSIQWNHFMYLRKARNEVVHPIVPYAVAEIREMGKHLNYVREGIGGFMKLLREQHAGTSLMFIDRLLTAPRVDFRYKGKWSLP